MRKQVNVPKLRFKTFVGDWVTKSLIELSENGFSNGAFNDPNKVGSGYRIINVKDMYVDGTINIDNLQRVALDKKEFQKNRVENGDVFFTRSSLVKEGIAYSNVNLNYVDDLTFDGHLIRMRPNKQMAYPVFLYYCFSTKNLRKQFIQKGKTTTMTTIGQDDIASVIIKLPILAEQTQIASFIEKVDDRISQLKMKKNLLERYKNGIMQQIFSQELRFKNDDGNEFADWKEKMLGEVGKFVGGGTPSTKDSEYWKGSIPWISSSDLTDNSIFRINASRFVTEEAIANSATKLVPANSVLIVSRVGVGKVVVNEYDLCTSQDFTSLIPNKDHPIFLAYLIKLKTNNLLGFNQGTSIKGFVKSDLETMKIKLPSLPEQQKIASFLTSLDDKIAQTSLQIEKMQLWKKGLLQQMFV